MVNKENNMMNFGQYTPKEFDATLVRRAAVGTAYVISANEYNSLPVNLRVKYYPLFRRADTTYRLYPRYMTVRRDIDPTTQVVHLVPKKRVVLQKQSEKNMPKLLQREILPINRYISLPNTDLSMKSTNTVARETQSVMSNRVNVTTQFTRF